MASAAVIGILALARFHPQPVHLRWNELSPPVSFEVPCQIVPAVETNTACQARPWAAVFRARRRLCRA